MKQPHKPPPKKELVYKIFKILKDVSSIDICIDLPYKPNIEAIKSRFTLTPFITKDGIATDTHYINNTEIPMLDKVVIYNKAYKNQLKAILWRIEATISVPNCKALALPLHEFKEIIDIATVKEKVTMKYTKEEMQNMTKADVEAIIKEMLSKDPRFRDAKITVGFKDKRGDQKR